LREFICKAWNEVGYGGGVMFWKPHLGEDNSDLGVMIAPCDGSSADIPDPCPVTTPSPVTTPGPVTAPVTTPDPVVLSRQLSILGGIS
ncbi:hypothetical protein GNI_020430, partial [Gregarina niphandrodes]